jgi:biopolymer transport protein ExbD
MTFRNEVLTVRFNRRQNSIRVFESAPVIFGLAVLLALTGIARWKLGSARAAPRAAAPAAPGQDAEHSVRVAISSDGSITMGGEGKEVALEDVTVAVRASGTKGKVELSVDPGARGATVDALLIRLRDAGVSQCTLLVDLAAARAGGPESSRADLEPDADLETLLVDVVTQGESVHFQIGSQTASSAPELKKQLEPLARLGGSISVRISHDGPFLHTASAVAACRDAGFATVFLVSGQPSR